MLKKLMSLAALLMLFGCGEAVTSAPDARILLLGDSMMASGRGNNRAVADAIETELREEVVDRSVVGARYFYYMPITGLAGLNLTAQFRQGKWDWIVLNGGGNDLLFGCGCWRCDWQIDRLISDDGLSGAIPKFVSKLRATGAQVVYVGYLRNPGIKTPIKGCGPAGNELDRRLTIMDGLDPGLHFLPMSDLVPEGDTSYHLEDLIHPSPKGSAGIGKRVAQRIAQ
ncbi:MAG: SGNH/GDSL hydrolase family protein [Gemmobacter sp.]|nr:SGNH/GDSL hydrolase family protein [Gemmobacter sp.]